MRVLVWQSYGMPRVYKAESPMHFFRIFDRLKSAVDGWGLQDDLDNLWEAMGRARDARQCERHFNGFAGKHKYTHEAFEQFEFVDVVE